MYIAFAGNSSMMETKGYNFSLCWPGSKKLYIYLGTTLDVWKCEDFHTPQVFHIAHVANFF